MSWFKNPLDFAEGLLDQVDKRVSSVVGPASHEGGSESRTAQSVRSEPRQSGWDDYQHEAIGNNDHKPAMAVTSPSKSPVHSRTGSTIKLPPRKVPSRTSTPPAAGPVISAVASKHGGVQITGSATDGPSKPVLKTPTKQEAPTPAVRSPARPSPQVNSHRSQPVSSASDLASSPPAAPKSRTKKLPVKGVKPDTPKRQGSSPATELDATLSSEEGAGWLSTAKQQETTGTSPVSSASSVSAAALQRPADTSAMLQQLPRPPVSSSSNPMQSPKAPSNVVTPTQPAAPAEPEGSPMGKGFLTTASENGTEGLQGGFIANGNGIDAHDTLDTAPPTHDLPESTGEAYVERDSPQADVAADISSGAGSGELREKLNTEAKARQRMEQEVSRLREELMAAQGRAAVAEAGLAEARDDLATVEERAAAAEDAATHADDAVDAAKQAADDTAATAAAAAEAAEARAAAAADAASAARSKAREAMERADLKADALRSCEARLGQLETELEQAAAARDSAQSQVTKLKADIAEAAQRAVMQGNEAVDSLQKDLNAAREAASAAQAEAQVERASAAEARISAERRLEAMEGSLGVAHAEASQSTRAAEEAMEALEAAEAVNASLQQKLQEASTGTPGAHEPAASSELQLQLESTEARCRDLDRASRQSQHRVEELEMELAEQRSGTARHALQELQSQLKQANQLLSERQSMWERSVAEHAARSLTLERQLALAQEKLQTVGRPSHSGGERRSATLAVSGEDVIPMDSLHGYYRFVSHRRFGKAFKSQETTRTSVQAIGGTVDSVTAQVVTVLRRYPLARVAVLLYVLFVHLLIYVLLGRMQHNATVALGAHAHPGGDATGTLSRFDTPINKMQKG